MTEPAIMHDQSLPEAEHEAMNNNVVNGAHEHDHGTMVIMANQSSASSSATDARLPVSLLLTLVLVLA